MNEHKFKIYQIKDGNEYLHNYYDNAESAETELLRIASCSEDFATVDRESIAWQIIDCLKHSTEEGELSISVLEDNYKYTLNGLLKLLGEIVGDKIAVVELDNNYEVIFIKGEWRFNDRATASIWEIRECDSI